ncbi:MAG: hypothetical protein WCF08_00685, partial [Anaerolineaceae bacterium]
MKNKFFIWGVVVSLVVAVILPSRTVNVQGKASLPPNSATSTTITSELQPLAGLLRPDGSLDLSTGFSGSLDPTGYQISYTPDGSPLFLPKAPLLPANTWNALGGG